MGCMFMLNLIPKPQSVKTKNGFYSLSKNTKVYTEIELPLLKAEKDENADFRIIKDSNFEKEAYYLNVDENGILIKASGKEGAYYALQSIRMLGRFDEGKNKVPFVEISDKPHFEWRGLMIDESRHMFGKDAIKKMLDNMFRLKLNIFHWHLTDDQGWRIEIKKYPLLTEVGSKRAYTNVGGWGSTKKDMREYAGYYTQEDIKEIVEYAKERCISIVPEIDVPAHFAAALAAYPELACRNLKREVLGYFGGLIPKKEGVTDWNRPACMGKEASIQFIMDVYEEVCDLFPFEYFHVGGDECDMSEWKKCPDCQRVMKENGFKTESELQLMLTNKLNDFLVSKGKHMIGWNEILQKEGVNKSVVAQYWTPQRDKKAEEYVNSGGKMILSKHGAFYFDMPYAKVPLKNTYTFNPSKCGVKKENEKNVLGVEGELWTEWIRSADKLEFMAFPRTEALAEVAWTDEDKRDYDEFVERLNHYKGIYKALDLNYAVDRVAMSKNLFKRPNILAKFHNGNPDLEFNSNEEFYLKGER